ncbi:MAG: transglutaminase domain-containing protein, partial [Oscillibacter sp.]|nr:transglutaminase domain-containing protein [Oscillibacter sp.]
NGWLYRVKDGAFLANVTEDGFAFGVDGRYTTGNGALDKYLTDIVRAQIDSTMDRDACLLALFHHVRDNYHYASGTAVERGATGWEAEYALDFFQTGKGNAWNFAAAYCCLARELGLRATAISGVVSSARSQNHSWVEIPLDGAVWIFDTELEMAYRQRNDFRFNLFKISYADAPFRYSK